MRTSLVTIRDRDADTVHKQLARNAMNDTVLVKDSQSINTCIQREIAIL